MANAFDGVSLGNESRNDDDSEHGSNDGENDPAEGFGYAGHEGIAFDGETFRVDTDMLATEVDSNHVIASIAAAVLLAERQKDHNHIIDFPIIWKGLDTTTFHFEGIFSVGLLCDLISANQTAAGHMLAYLYAFKDKNTANVDPAFFNSFAIAVLLSPKVRLAGHPVSWSIEILNAVIENLDHNIFPSAAVIDARDKQQGKNALKRYDMNHVLAFQQAYDNRFEAAKKEWINGFALRPICAYVMTWENYNYSWDTHDKDPASLINTAVRFYNFQSGPNNKLTYWDKLDGYRAPTIFELYVFNAYPALATEYANYQTENDRHTDIRRNCSYVKFLPSILTRFWDSGILKDWGVESMAEYQPKKAVFYIDNPRTFRAQTPVNVNQNREGSQSSERMKRDNRSKKTKKDTVYNTLLHPEDTQPTETVQPVVTNRYAQIRNMSVNEMLRGKTALDYFGPISAGKFLRTSENIPMLELVTAMKDYHIPEYIPSLEFTRDGMIRSKGPDYGVAFLRFNAAFWAAPSTVSFDNLVQYVISSKGDKLGSEVKTFIKVVIASMIATAVGCGNMLRGGKANLLELDEHTAEGAKVIQILDRAFSSAFGTAKTSDGRPANGRSNLRTLVTCNHSWSVLAIIVSSYVRNGYLNAPGGFAAERLSKGFSEIMASWFEKVSEIYGTPRMASQNRDFEDILTKQNSWQFRLLKVIMNNLWEDAAIKLPVYLYYDPLTLASTGIKNALTNVNSIDLRAPPVGTAPYVSARAVIAALMSSVSNMWTESVKDFMASSYMLESEGLHRFRYSTLSPEILGKETLPPPEGANKALPVAGAAVKVAMAHKADKDKGNSRIVFSNTVYNARSLINKSDPAIESEITEVVRVRDNFWNTFHQFIDRAEETKVLMSDAISGLVGSMGPLEKLVTFGSRKRHMLESITEAGQEKRTG